MGAYTKTAIDAGWVVVSADTDLGNPRLEDNQLCKDTDLAIHTAAINALCTSWPNFKTWDFACCGHSGGAKASFYRVGDLLVSELNVIGLYLSGCNQNMTDNAREETRYQKSLRRTIKVWISNGEKDDISTVAHAESLEQSIKSSRYGEIRLELHDGGHIINQKALNNALSWFTSPEA